MCYEYTHTYLSRPTGSVTGGSDPNLCSNGGGVLLAQLGDIPRCNMIFSPSSHTAKGGVYGVIIGTEKLLW